MITEKMKEILLYCLAEEYEFYPEDYSRNSIHALLRKDLLEQEDDFFAITPQGIKALGLPPQIHAKRPKTIIKKVINLLNDGTSVELISPKAIPAIAADEDHYNQQTSWHHFDEALFATTFLGDQLEYVMTQIACDYAKKAGHHIYFERVHHLLLFYDEEE